MDQETKIMDHVRQLASKNPVVIFSRSTCCMSYSTKRLLFDLGASPAIYELDKEPKGRDIERALIRLLGRNPPIPAVFIGGQLVGSTDEVMSNHINGYLVPMLKTAKAIFL